MTRVLGLDFETTGLDTNTARIIEVGAVVWDVDNAKPLHMVSSLVNEDYLYPLPDEIKKLTGLYDEMLKEFGLPLWKIMDKLHMLIDKHGVSHIIAHNGENYDKPVLVNEVSRLRVSKPLFFSTPWIDTRHDLPFAEEPVSRRLSHLALDHGFINPFPHRAVFDVLTMLKIMGKYKFSSIVEYSQIPFVTVRAMVSYEDREKAKQRRYSWEKIGDKAYPKAWVKKIKADKFEQEKAECNESFLVVQID